MICMFFNTFLDLLSDWFFCSKVTKYFGYSIPFILHQAKPVWTL